jgi:EmrB/QacA subfamily drug resistance transporter
MTLLPFSTPQPCDGALIQLSRADTVCPQRDKPWVLATAILGSSVAFIEGSVVNLALPAMQTDLGIGSIQLQWVINVYLLTVGAFMLVSGSLGDRFGLRRIFILGCAVFALGALGCVAAPSFAPLLAARIVQGLGGALLIPTSLALIGRHFAEAERARAIGTWAGASALTTAVGPALGGWLVDLWSWRAVFLLVAPLALLSMATAWWRVPADPARGVGSRDYTGALLLAGSLGLLVFTLLSDGGALSRLGLLALAALAGVAFLRRESTFDAPVLPLGLFRSRSFAGANVMTLLLYAALSGALYFLPFNLIQVQGYSATRAGAAFLPMTVLLGIGSTFAGDLLTRYEPRKVLTLGPLVAAVGFALLAIPGTNASYASGFLPAIVIIGVGMTISVAPLTTVVLNSVPDSQAGTASGINNTVTRLAGVGAVALLTAIAIGRFSDTLTRVLRNAGVPQAVTGSLSSRAAELAELRPPANVDTVMTETIRSSVAAAYIVSFRWVVILCAAMAVLSGLVAWFTLEAARSPRSTSRNCRRKSAATRGSSRR